MLTTLIGPLTLPAREPPSALSRRPFVFFGHWLLARAHSLLVSIVLMAVFWVAGYALDLLLSLFQIPDTSALYQAVLQSVTYVKGIPNHVDVPGEFYVLAAVILLLKSIMLLGLKDPVPIFGLNAPLFTLAAGMAGLIYFHNVTLFVPDDLGGWDAPALGLLASFAISFQNSLYWAGLEADLPDIHPEIR